MRFVFKVGFFVIHNTVALYEDTVNISETHELSLNDIHLI